MKLKISKNKFVKSAKTFYILKCLGPAGSLAELMEQSSGTGGGLPLLVQRTIAKQVILTHPVFKQHIE